MKIIIALSFLCAIFYPLYSQQFHGGPLLGVAATQLDGDYYSGYNKGGIIAGGFVNRQISDALTLQMEIRYIQKGSYKKSKADDPEYVYYKSRLNYFEIPLLIKYKYKPKITFDAGLALGYLFKAKEEWYDKNDGFIHKEEDFYFKKYELSIMAGLSYEFMPNLSVSGRFSYSVFKIRGPKYENPHIMNRGQYNNVLTFILYYQF